MTVLRFLSGSAFSPLFLFLIATAITIPFRRTRMPWTALSAAIVALVAIAAIAYLFTPILFDDTETVIASVAALVLRGAPIYPPLDSTARYILLYGPLTYLAHIPFYLLFGENLFSFKLLGVLSFLVSLAGTYRIARRYVSRPVSLTAVGCVALISFRYVPALFWGRIDPLLFCAAVCCVWASVEGPDWLAALVCAVGFALIVNLKLTGVVYLLPITGLLVSLRGARLAAFAIVGSLLLFPLPFLLPVVSLTNYATILHAAAGHGLVPEIFLRNLQYSVLFAAPVLVALSREDVRHHLSTPQKLVLLLLGVGLFGGCLAGAKAGAGSYHLLPFLPSIVQLYFWVTGQSAKPQPFGGFALAWVLTLLFVSVTEIRSAYDQIHWVNLDRQAVADVRSVERQFPGETIEVGYGADFFDPRTRYGYLTTFHGEPYTVSGAALRDLQFGHIPIPPATIRYIESCGTQIWLIPKGNPPFTAWNSYFPGDYPAFDTAFREAFLAHYAKYSSTPAYDVWKCTTR